MSGSDGSIYSGNYMDTGRTHQQPLFLVQFLPSPPASSSSHSSVSSSSNFSLRSGAERGAEPLQEPRHPPPSNLRRHCWSSDGSNLRTTSPKEEPQWAGSEGLRTPFEGASRAHTETPAAHHRRHHHHHDSYCHEGPHIPRHYRKPNSSVRMGVGPCSGSNTRPADHANAEHECEETKEHGRISEHAAVSCTPDQDAVAPMTERITAECAEAIFTTSLSERDPPSRTGDTKAEPAEHPQAGGRHSFTEELSAGPEDAGRGLIMKPERDLESATCASQLAKMVLDGCPAQAQGGWISLGNGRWIRLAHGLIQWGFERRGRRFDDSQGSCAALSGATKGLHELLEWLSCVLEPFRSTRTLFVIDRLGMLVREAAACQRMEKYHTLREVLSPDSDTMAALRWCYTFFLCLRKKMSDGSVKMGCGDIEVLTSSGSNHDMTRKVMDGEKNAGVLKTKEAKHSIRPVPKPELLALVYPAASSASMDNDDDDDGDGNDGDDGRDCDLDVQTGRAGIEVLTSSGTSTETTRDVIDGDQNAGVVKIEGAKHCIPVMPKPGLRASMHPAASSASLDDDDEDGDGDDLDDDLDGKGGGDDLDVDGDGNGDVGDGNRDGVSDGGGEEDDNNSAPEVLDKSQPSHIRCIAALARLKDHCSSTWAPKPALNKMVSEELDEFQKHLKQTVSMTHYRDFLCVRRLILAVLRPPSIFLKPNLDDIEWCISRLSQMGKMEGRPVDESGPSAAAVTPPPAAPATAEQLPPDDHPSPRPKLPRCMKTPPWLRLPGDLGQRVLQSCSININGPCTVIVSMVSSASTHSRGGQQRRPSPEPQASPIPTMMKHP